jgi:hypothetical protein
MDASECLSRNQLTRKWYATAYGPCAVCDFREDEAPHARRAYHFGVQRHVIRGVAERNSLELAEIQRQATGMSLPPARPLSSIGGHGRVKPMGR